MNAEPNRVLIPDITAPPRPPRDAAPFALQGATMGTTWSARGFAPPGLDTARLQRDIEALFDEIVLQMSPWEAHSELSRFNDLATGEAMSLSSHFRAVLDCALTIGAETDGAFDPTLGALVDLWGFGARPAPHDTPAQAVLNDALAQSGWRRLRRHGPSVLQPGGLRLDLNGIAKGYAVDQLAACVANAGAVSFLVEIGGELRAAGVKPDGQPWWTEIERPPHCEAAPLLVALHDLAIATSGDYRRSAIVNGETIAHTLDPRTGKPLINAMASVTVLHPSCMHADAYATAITVMGMDDGLRFAEAHGLAVHMLGRTQDGFDERFSRTAARMLT